jgi:hypothetical protein
MKRVIFKGLDYYELHLVDVDRYDSRWHLDRASELVHGQIMYVAR